jgi:Cof subfamily protein (haloacid dehalogenase superfamily)
LSDQRYRFLLFDLDGTLLMPDRQVHAEVAQTLGALQAAGIGVGFATGRPPRSVQPYVDALSPTGPNICFNGALVWDLAEGRALFSRGLEREPAITALEVARRLDVHANLYVGDEIFIEAVSETSRASAVKDGVEQEPVGALAPWLRAREAAPTKILFIDEPDRLVALERELRAGDDTSVLVRSEPTYLEMLAAGVNKGAALDAVTAKTGVPLDEMIAFGDNLNDLELIERAGLGVAMSNAHEQLRWKADIVIGDNAHDTIARFLGESFWLDDGGLAPVRSL